MSAASLRMVPTPIPSGSPMAEARQKRPSFPIPDPPPDFDSALGCYGPGRDRKRCGGKVVSKGCCYTHYNQWRWNGELRPPNPMKERGSRSGHNAHGIHWPSKKLVEQATRAAKRDGMSLNAFIVDCVEKQLAARKDEE